MARLGLVRGGLAAGDSDYRDPSGHGWMGVAEENLFSPSAGLTPCPFRQRLGSINRQASSADRSGTLLSSTCSCSA